MRRLTWALSILFAASGALGCSGESSGGGGDDTSTGGQSGSTATGGGSGTGTGGASGTGTGGGGTGATGGSASGGTGQTGGGGGQAGSGGSGFTKTGICGRRATANVTTTAFAGTEEFYMVSQEVVQDGRLDEFNCLVRFTVTRSGDAPAGCQDLDGAACLWTHEVTLSNPTVVTNIDNACEKNELGWNMSWMTGLDGSHIDYGYIDMYQSHDSVVMSYDSGMWDVFGRASWDDMTGDFSYDNRLGNCQY